MGRQIVAYLLRRIHPKMQTLWNLVRPRKSVIDPRIEKLVLEQRVDGDNHDVDCRIQKCYVRKAGIENQIYPFA